MYEWYIYCEDELLTINCSDNFPKEGETLYPIKGWDILPMKIVRVEGQEIEPMEGVIFSLSVGVFTEAIR